MIEPVLHLAGLQHRYGERLALDGVDVTVNPGEAVALLGPNGAGKSTTVSVLLGLLQPDAGTATVCGRAPRAAVSAGLVGAMLQDAGLPANAKVGELIGMIAALYPSPIDPKDALAMAGAADLFDRSTEALSGGQAQRVRLALALVGDPTLLVLDEPTSAMDPEARRAFWRALRDQTAGGRGVLFATHHLDEAQAIADRVVVLANGRVVASGTPNEVAALGGQHLIRAHVPNGVAAELRALPGVAAATHESGGTITLRCTDSDLALRAFLTAYPEATRIEVRPAGLEDAFLAMAEGGWSARATPTTPGGEPAATNGRPAGADLETIR